MPRAPPAVWDGLPGHTGPRAHAGYRQKGRLASCSIIFYTAEHPSLCRHRSGSVPECFMRDEGGGKDGLALETASRLFPQQSLLQTRTIPGGAQRTSRQPPASCPQPPSWARAEELRLPACSAPRRHLGAGRWGGGRCGPAMALFPAFAGAAQPGEPPAGSSEGSTRGKVLGEPSFP